MILSLGCNDEQKNKISEMEIKLNELVASSVDNEKSIEENTRLNIIIGKKGNEIDELEKQLKLLSESCVGNELLRAENATQKKEILSLQQSSMSEDGYKHLKQLVTTQEEELLSMRQEINNLKQESEDKIELEMTSREEEILSLKTQVAELKKPKLQKDIDSMSKRIADLTSSNKLLERKMREIKLSDSEYKQKNKRDIDNLTDNLRSTQEMTEVSNQNLNAKVKEIRQLQLQITRMAKDVAKNGSFAFSKNDYKPVS